MSYSSKEYASSHPTCAMFPLINLHSCSPIAAEYLIALVAPSLGLVRVVRPAYYLELQRISRGGCGGDLSIERSAKVLEEVNKSGCVTTVALIA